MTVIERIAAEKLAEGLAEVASNDEQLLLSGDPLKLVASHIENADHRVLLQASMNLLLRFHDTVSGKQPPLDKLDAVVEKLALPAFSKLETCLTARRALQAACSLTPLLNRAVALAVQCCALAIRGVSDVAIIHPLTRGLTDISEVFSDAIVSRAETFRPFDAARISASHQRFADLQAEASTAARQLPWSATGSQLADASSRKILAPAPVKHSHHWRNDQLRQFWHASCSTKYLDGSVPIDALTILLLQAAGAELSLPNREAVMRRLHKLTLQKSGYVSAAELDTFGPEMRRCGGLRAWVHAVSLSGGEEAPVRADVSTPRGPKSLANTWGSANSGYSTTTPLSARTTGSSWATRGGNGKKPFVLSASFGRRPPTGREDMSSPLADSVSRGLLKASQRLVLGEKAPVDGRDVTGETALHIAASQDFRHAPLASMLLSKGADANSEDRHLATPLHAAAASGHSMLTKELIQHGGDVRREDRWGSTPLHRAADNGQVEVAKLLLQQGASVHPTDEWGATPLHRASARGQLAVAEKLLELGTDPDAEDKRGERALHVAAARGDYAVVKLLLEHGAVATARSRIAGKTPEECAHERGHMGVVALLQNRQEWIAARSQSVVAAA